MSRPQMDKSCAARLRAARSKIYRSAGAAARSSGWPEQTYRSHENGLRGYDLQTAKSYALKFGVRWEWLLTGEGEMTAALKPAPDLAKFADGLISSLEASTHGKNGSSDVVVPQQDEIEVYLGATGGVVIRAVSSAPDGEDQTIVIRPENVDAVVAAMLRVKAEALG